MIRNAIRTGYRHQASKDPLVRCLSFGAMRNALSSARQAPQSSTSSSSISTLASSLSSTSSSSTSSTLKTRRRTKKTTTTLAVAQPSHSFSTTPTAFDASALAPSQLSSLATGNDAEARRALFRESIADAAGALYSTLLTDDRASAEVFPPHKIDLLQEKLGFVFPKEHSWLLRAALVHKSYKAESGKYAASDLLSWHGDAVLYSMLTESTIAAYPGAGIPDLTAARVSRISRESLSVLARSVGLDELVAVGKSFQNIGTGGALSRGMLGESFEAVLGAISATGGGTDAVRSVYFKVAPLPKSGRLRDLMAETMMSGGGGGGGGGG